MNAPIIALATPPIKSALAIIRLSGRDVISLTQEFLGISFKTEAKTMIKHGFFSFNHQKLDEVVVLFYFAPYSFTGEDVVELITHGSMIIVHEIINAYLSKGVTLAKRGEFSLRAFLNHKIDLLQAEAINDLINATTPSSKRLALESLEGIPSQQLVTLKDELETTLARLEVAIDFSEYRHLTEVNIQEQKAVILRIREQFKKIYQVGQKQKLIKDGVKVAILGRPNAGKSSLLNALLNKDRAIVSSVPGTTRDTIEDSVIINGIKYTFIDTAGLRDSSDFIEKEGVKRTYKTLKEVDLIIYLYEQTADHEVPLTIKQSKKPLIVVVNKADLVRDKIKDTLYVTAIKKHIKPLINKMEEVLSLDVSLNENTVVNSFEGLSIVRRIIMVLGKTITSFNKQLPLEIALIPLQEAYALMLELLGQRFNRDLTEAVFSRFCVGK